MQKGLQYKKFILLIGDVIILYASLYLTLAIRYWQMPTRDLWQGHYIPFTIVFGVWILIFYISGLYNLHIAINNANFFRLTFRSLGISVLFSLVFFYANPQINIAPKRNMLIYIIIFIILFYFWRRIYNGLLKSYLPKEIIAVIGLNNQAKELIEELAGKPHLGYSIVFVVDDQKSGVEKINDVPVIQGVADLNKLILEKKVSTIILASNPHESQELRTSLFESIPLKINYINLLGFYESLTGKIPLESLSQMWFLENLSEGRKNFFDLSKRAYDIILALLLLVITIIFWPFIACLIKFTSNGPILFKQTRLGKNNKPFKILKFRTMAIEGNDFSPTRANDSRVTKSGTFLRKTRFDELPQIINILKGEMSFVGPRPERPELIKDLENRIPFYRERMLVKPGITGWDQISGEYHSPSYEDSLKKLQYDLFYIKNRSIYLDLSIILRTIATILSQEGI